MAKMLGGSWEEMGRETERETAVERET